MFVITGRKECASRHVAILALSLLIVTIGAVPAVAQFSEFQLPPGQTSGGSMRFGPGYTNIDGKDYFSFMIMPEIAFGKIGVGLSIPLLFDTQNNWQLRKIDWNSGKDYARVIRYLRYGVKRDRVYARVGELTNTLLGHGFVVYYYNNAVDDNYPKRGMQLDLDFEKFGFESLVGNFGRQEIYGARGYVRPLQFLEKPIPFLRNFTIGGTLITDRDSALLSPLTVYGLDLEQSLLHRESMDLYLYFDWSSIGDWDTQEHGHGFAYGIATDVRAPAGLFGIGAKFEMRNLSRGFAASLISPLWDIKKADIMADLQAQPATNGWYGELAGTVLGRISLRGSYFQTGDAPTGDQFVMHADATKLVPGVAMQAYFVKQGIKSGESLFKLNEKALTIAEIGWRPYPFMTLLMRYEWSYVFDDIAGKYVSQKRVEPRIEFGFSW